LSQLQKREKKASHISNIEKEEKIGGQTTNSSVSYQIEIRKVCNQSDMQEVKGQGEKGGFGFESGRPYMTPKRAVQTKGVFRRYQGAEKGENNRKERRCAKDTGNDRTAKKRVPKGRRVANPPKKGYG